ncbi:TPA: hypothetical protein DD449_02595 [Candidatus Berkelbacteria bacterium]|nr:hypothetical protein [Candidatus Berkelbacteria bacterium]
MKKMNLFFLAFTMLLLFAVNSINAQTGFTLNAEEFLGAGYKTIATDCKIDSTDTLYTNSFDLSGYDKVMKGFKLLTVTGTNDTARITIQRQIYVLGDWRADKTLYTADSLFTFGTISDTAASVKNRLMIYGTSYLSASHNPDSVRVQLKYEIVPK